MKRYLSLLTLLLSLLTVNVSHASSYSESLAGSVLSHGKEVHILEDTSILWQLSELTALQVLLFSSAKFVPLFALKLSSYYPGYTSQLMTGAFYAAKSAQVAGLGLAIRSLLGLTANIGHYLGNRVSRDISAASCGHRTGEMPVYIQSELLSRLFYMQAVFTDDQPYLKITALTIVDPETGITPADTGDQLWWGLYKAMASKGIARLFMKVTRGENGKEQLQVELLPVENNIIGKSYTLPVEAEGAWDLETWAAWCDNPKSKTYSLLHPDVINYVTDVIGREPAELDFPLFLRGLDTQHNKGVHLVDTRLDRDQGYWQVFSPYTSILTSSPGYIFLADGKRPGRELLQEAREYGEDLAQRDSGQKVWSQRYMMLIAATARTGVNMALQQMLVDALISLRPSPGSSQLVDVSGTWQANNLINTLAQYSKNAVKTTNELAITVFDRMWLETKAEAMCMLEEYSGRMVDFMGLRHSMHPTKRMSKEQMRALMSAQREKFAPPASVKVVSSTTHASSDAVRETLEKALNKEVALYAKEFLSKLPPTPLSGVMWSDLYPVGIASSKITPSQFLEAYIESHQMMLEKLNRFDLLEAHMGSRQMMLEKLNTFDEDAGALIGKALKTIAEDQTAATGYVNADTRRVAKKFRQYLIEKGVDLSNITPATVTMGLENTDNMDALFSNIVSGLSDQGRTSQIARDVVVALNVFVQKPSFREDQLGNPELPAAYNMLKQAVFSLDLLKPVELIRALASRDDDDERDANFTASITAAIVGLITRLEDKRVADGLALFLIYEIGFQYVETNTPAAMQTQKLMPPPAQPVASMSMGMGSIPMETEQSLTAAHHSSKAFTKEPIHSHKPMSTEEEDEDEDYVIFYSKYKLQPSAKYFNRFVKSKIASEWYTVGLELGIEKSALEIIKLNSHHNVAESTMGMYNKWHESDPKQSWVKLINAISVSGMKSEAIKIAKQLGDELRGERKSDYIVYAIKQPLSFKAISKFVVPKIASTWQEVAIQLSDTGDDMYQVARANHPGDVAGAARDFFQHWLTAYGNRATWAKLLKALLEPGVQLIAVHDEILKDISH